MSNLLAMRFPMVPDETKSAASLFNNFAAVASNSEKISSNFSFFA